MKRVLSLVILLASMSSQAQVKVSGKISDAKGKAVGGVSVVLRVNR